MKAYVDQDTCISCGMCVGTCPKVFSFNEDEKSTPINEELTGDLLDLAKEAEDGCPVAAITIE